MKIVVFLEDFGATGVVRNAIAIASALARRKHEVILLTATPNGVLRDTVPPDVRTEALSDAARTGTRKTIMRRALGNFRAFVRKEKPDVVFSAGNHGHLLVLAGTSFLRCRTVIRISNDLAHQRKAKKVGLVKTLALEGAPDRLRRFRRSRSSGRAGRASGRRRRSCRCRLQADRRAAEDHGRSAASR